MKDMFLPIYGYEEGLESQLGKATLIS